MKHGTALRTVTALFGLALWAAAPAASSPMPASVKVRQIIVRGCANAVEMHTAFENARTIEDAKNQTLSLLLAVSPLSITARRVHWRKRVWCPSCAQLPHTPLDVQITPHLLAAVVSTALRQMYWQGLCQAGRRVFCRVFSGFPACNGDFARLTAGANCDNAGAKCDKTR